MKSVETLIFIALGEASMCWTPTPTGVFESTRAREIGEKLLKDLGENPQSTDPLRKALINEVASLQRLALAGETGECSATQACGEIANRLPDLLGLLLGLVLANKPAETDTITFNNPSYTEWLAARPLQALKGQILDLPCPSGEPPSCATILELIDAALAANPAETPTAERLRAQGINPETFLPHHPTESAGKSPKAVGVALLLSNTDALKLSDWKGGGPVYRIPELKHSLLLFDDGKTMELKL